MYNTIAWSYELLPDAERKLFTRLAVFVAGCTLSAVEAVCTTDDDWSMDVLDGVSALLDKSLVRRLDEVENESRIGMLETIRAYAAERLADSGQEGRLRDQHLAFFLGLAEEAASGLRGPQQGTWNTRLVAEMDNLRAALEWALADRVRAEEALRLSSALRWFYRSEGLWTEARLWLQKALEQGKEVTTNARIRACLAASELALYQGNYKQAQELAEEGLVLSRARQEVRGIARSLLSLGVVAAVQGEHHQATALYEEGLSLLQQKWVQRPEEADRRLLLELMSHSALQAALRGRDYERGFQLAWEGLALAREGQDITMTEASYLVLGMITYFDGQAEQAEALFKESLALAQRAGDKWYRAGNLLFLGRIAYEQGRLPEAADHLRASTLLYWESGDKERITQCLIAWAGYAATQQQYERVVHLLGAAQIVLDETGLVLEDGHLLDLKRLVAEARRHLSEVTFGASWTAGQAMTLEGVVHYALEG